MKSAVREDWEKQKRVKALEGPTNLREVFRALADISQICDRCSYFPSSASTFLSQFGSTTFAGDQPTRQAEPISIPVKSPVLVSIFQFHFRLVCSGFVLDFPPDSCHSAFVEALSA